MNIFVGGGNEAEEFVFVELLYLEYRTPDNRDKMVLYTTDADIPPEVLKEFDISKFKKLKGKFRMPDFVTHNSLFRESTMYKPNGDPYTSSHLFKFNVLRKLLVHIDLDTQSSDINEKNFGKVDPTIMEWLYDTFYEQYLNPTLTLEELKSFIKD